MTHTGLAAPSGVLLTWQQQLSRSHPLLLAAVAAAAVLIGVSLAQDAVALSSGDRQSLDLGWWPRRFFDVDAERSAPTWLSGVTLFSCSLILFMIWRRQRRSGAPPRHEWIVLSLALLYVSIDEYVGLHDSEQFQAAVTSITGRGEGLLHFAWAAPAGVASLVALTFLIPFFRTLPRWMAAFMLTAAGVYLSGAVVAEMFAGASAATGGGATWSYRVITHIEEALEQAGVIIFLYALLRFHDGAGELRTLAHGGRQEHQPR